MTDYTQKMLQHLHTQMQNALAPMPADKKMDSLVVLQFPGLAVAPSEYDEEGLSESLRTILDTGVNMQTAYQPTGGGMFQLFGEILRNMEVPSGRELSRQEKEKLKIAEIYLSKNSSKYQEYYNRYLEIQAELLGAKGKDEKIALQMKMRRLNQEWDAHGRQKYMEYSNVVRELHTSSPASYVKSMLDNYELYPGGDISLTPSGWFEEQEQLSWTSMKFNVKASEHSVHSHTESTNRTLEEFYQTPGIWTTIAGWFGIRKGVTVTTEISELIEKANEEFANSNMNMTWDMLPVVVGRPWLDMNVLAIEKAKMAGVTSGGYSTGELSRNNKGTFPGYITEFIVAKNIRMTMELSNQLTEALKRNSSSITCGMLGGGKGDAVNIVDDDRDYSKGEGNVTISTGPGKQIIGYIVRPFPRFPSV